MPRHATRLAIGLAVAHLRAGVRRRGGRRAREAAQAQAPAADHRGARRRQHRSASTTARRRRASTARSRRRTRCTRRWCARRSPWSVFEPQQGQIDAGTQAYADRLVSDAAADGIRVIMVVDSTPCWASSAPAALLSELLAGPRRAKRTSGRPRNPAAYAAFMAYLAGRYGAHLAAIEVWNEPDQSNEAVFRGPRQSRTLRGACCARPTRRSRRPTRACRCSAARSSAPTARSCGCSTQRASRATTTASRSTTTRSRSRALRSIHEVQLANGDTTPLWLDEFGWSSCWPQRKHRAGTGLRDAADPGAATWRTRSARWRAAPTWRRRSPTSCRTPRAEDFGVLTRRAARASRRSRRSRARWPPRSGSISPVTLRLRRSGASVVASGSAPVGDYMQLEAFQGKTAALPGAVHAGPLQPLLAHAALGARHARPARARLPVLEPASARPPRRTSERAHSALRNSATTVSARIFRSRPSDQWAM